MAKRTEYMNDARIINLKKREMKKVWKPGQPTDAFSWLF